ASNFNARRSPAAKRSTWAPSGARRGPKAMASRIQVVESPEVYARDRRDGSAVVSVVLSFWNEEDVLPELIRRLRAAFAGLLASGEIGDYELIFVNDASTDRSPWVLQEAAKGRNDLKIINMSRN